MGLIPFNHYYALFAGIASALVGLEDVRKYFEKKLFIKHESIEAKCNEHIALSENYIGEFEKMIQACINTKNYMSVSKISKLIPQTQKIISSFKARKRKLNGESEMKAISKKITGLHIFGGLFCISLLLISAFNETGYIGEDYMFKFVSNYGLLSFGCLIFLSVFIKGEVNYSVLMISILMFLLVFSTSLFISSSFKGLIPTSHLTIYVSLAVVCAMPLTILFISSYLKWTIFPWITNFRIAWNKRFLEKQSAKFTDFLIK